MTFDRWRDDVDRLMRRDYAIGVEDAGLADEELARWCHEGVGPDAFVRWFAEKYDLTSVAEGTAFR